MNKYDCLAGTHDIPSLSDWGPWGKDYWGLSHIACARFGHRADFFLVPGLYRRDPCPPDAQRECGLAVREASPDLRYYAYRQQLWSGRDEIFADVAYVEAAEDVWLARCELVNRTDARWQAALELYAGVVFNRDGDVTPELPENGTWLPAVDHKELIYARPTPIDALSWDGWRRGEQPMGGTVSGYVVGGGASYAGFAGKGRSYAAFGRHAGDRIVFSAPSSLADGRVWLRARLEKGAAVAATVAHGGREQTARLEGDGGFGLYPLWRGALRAGEPLTLTAGGGADVFLDGLAFFPADARETPRFVPTVYDNTPAAAWDMDARMMTVRFPAIDAAYSVHWSDEPAAGRTLYADDAIHSLAHGYASRNPYYNELRFGGQKQKFAGVYLLPLDLPPGGRRVAHFLAAQGALPPGFDRSPAALEACYERARTKRTAFRPVPAGEPYREGQERMAALTLANAVYPVYCKRGYIRHHSPSRYYYSLYQWDAGFIGLGFAEINLRLAAENLNAYLTEPGDPEAAFILHGTPLPIQAILFHELHNRGGDREFLTFFYPRLRQFYRFLAGHAPTSKTRFAGSGLLATWEYFYNTGGWDDYPPQWEIYNRDIQTITPVCTTAYAIRFAKILRGAARRLGLDADGAGYDADIALFETALDRHAWDEDAGCYSYVEHDENRRPLGIWRHASGVNYNLGLDGASPLAAGAGDPTRRARMTALLRELMTPSGLTAVSPKAPYCREDGYWNGAVWMPHQWLMWKALLDEGEWEFAERIGETALSVWQREHELSGCCYEHFSALTGRGCGSHAFGGLSTPVLKWFHAYYAPGRLTGGFDCWVDGRSTDEAADRFALAVEGDPGQRSAVLYVPERPVKAVAYSGGDAAAERRGAHWVVLLPRGTAGELVFTF